MCSSVSGLTACPCASWRGVARASQRVHVCRPESAATGATRRRCAWACRAAGCWGVQQLFAVKEIDAHKLDVRGVGVYLARGGDGGGLVVRVPSSPSVVVARCALPELPRSPVQGPMAFFVREKRPFFLPLFSTYFGHKTTCIRIK